MWLSDGGKYLVAFQDGVSRHADNGQRASFVLLDANTNEPIRKYEIPGPGEWAVTTPDASRLFIVSGRAWTWEQYNGWAVFGGSKDLHVLYTFSRESDRPIGEVPLADNPIADLRLSPDGAQVYVLDRGFTKFKKPWPAGNLYIVNSQSGKLVNSQSVGVFPAFYPDEASASMNICSWATAPVGFMGNRTGRVLVIKGQEIASTTDMDVDMFVQRFPSEPGRWVIGSYEMRFFPDAGSADTRPVILRLAKGAKSPPPKKPIDADPIYPAIALPGSSAAAFRLENGKVALVDLNERLLLEVVSTGRKGVKIGRALQRFGVSLGASMASGLAFGSVGSPYAPIFMAGKRLAGPLDMVARADSQFLYAHDSGSDDVTIIDVSKRSVAGVVPVGKGCSGLVRHPMSNHLYAVGSEDVVIIDMSQNTRAGRYTYRSGKLRSVLADETNARVLLATDSELLVFDGKSVEPSIITGLQKPVFLAQP